MTIEEILLEEANLGTEVLRVIKKHTIEQNAWSEFAHLKQILNGGQPDREEIMIIQEY